MFDFQQFKSNDSTFPVGQNFENHRYGQHLIEIHCEEGVDISDKWKEVIRKGIALTWEQYFPEKPLSVWVLVVKEFLGPDGQLSTKTADYNPRDKLIRIGMENTRKNRLQMFTLEQQLLIQSAHEATHRAQDEEGRFISVPCDENNYKHPVEQEAWNMSLRILRREYPLYSLTNKVIFDLTNGEKISFFIPPESTFS